MKSMNVTSMGYSELDELVNKTWPAWKGQFESCAEFEWSNDEDHSIEDVGRPIGQQWTIPTPERIAEETAERAENLATWATGKRPFCCGEHQLMDSLFDAGVIPAGNYLIEVSW